MGYESRGTNTVPDAMYMEIRGLPLILAERLSELAVVQARSDSPKLSGATAAGLRGFFGEGFFGVQWSTAVTWFQEGGTQPHTMSRVAGKVIPMWIDDPTGAVKRENPKAKTRTTRSGRPQTLIFRRAAKQGQRRVDGSPASYPGAPGRIATREAGKPLTTPGRVAGRIAQGNVGVRWRHPGLKARGFIQNAIEYVARTHGIHGSIQLREAA